MLRKKIATVKRKGKESKVVDEEDDETIGTFQQTVRCSLREVIDAAKLLKDPHRKIVQDAGFGCVFEWVLDGNVSRPLACVLLMRIETTTMKIDCGPGLLARLCLLTESLCTMFLVFQWEVKQSPDLQILVMMKRLRS